ncbi:uncharacterized protein LOC120556489 [Perca fluviatilis]|uniref:uncharacterized protein LOC120556489 n=1 Tax=Perca fluviatilis TaxID=8168 RepID=UPI0019668D1A|nr:uncharacterized protein LOC120556489 [Perca fluviatilis]
MERLNAGRTWCGYGTWELAGRHSESRSVFCTEGRGGIEGEVKRQNKEWISELQVQIDRPKTLLQDKRQELQRKLAVLKLEVCILRTKVKTQKLERQRTAPAAFSTHGHSPPLMSPQRAAPSGGRGSAEGGGPVVGIQQAITPREQKVTTLEQDLEAAQSQTTERKQSKVEVLCSVRRLSCPQDALHCQPVGPGMRVWKRRKLRSGHLKLSLMRRGLKRRTSRSRQRNVCGVLRHCCGSSVNQLIRTAERRPFGHRNHSSAALDARDEQRYGGSCGAVAD